MCVCKLVSVIRACNFCQPYQWLVPLNYSQPQLSQGTAMLASMYLEWHGLVVMYIVKKKLNTKEKKYTVLNLMSVCSCKTISGLCDHVFAVYL